MTLLPFVADYNDKVSRIADFWQLADHDIPATPGVYLLIAKPSIRFRYPAGWSSVYYIGHTESLRRRLLGHLKWHTKAKGDHSLYEPRHEYGAKFGGRYCYIEMWRSRSARGLEDIVLAKFAKLYRSFPVANSAGAWKHID